jgi:ssDNA-binding Zn-finger/Zn-ribbon topoisomerase 1
MRYRMHDRRAADRPANGDTALCPQCGIGTVEFNERYRVLLASGKTASIPAWACDRPECRFERAARSDVRPVQSNSADLRARSRRQLMKARAVLHRARRTISKSLSRKKRH